MDSEHLDYLNLENVSFVNSWDFVISCIFNIMKKYLGAVTHQYYTNKTVVIDMTT